MKGVISDARVAGNDGAFFPSVVCGRLNSARLFSRRVFGSLKRKDTPNGVSFRLEAAQKESLPGP